MKAVRYHQFGGTEVLQQEQVPTPSPAEGDILVKVVATSFNPVDDHIRLGVLAEAIPTALPIVPGLDLAGTVVELGAGVEGFDIGDAVIALFPLDEHGGAAEYAVLKAHLATAAPRSIDLIDAASLPLTGLAARQATVELAAISSGQTVLVNGAGGAVGSIVVQLAVDAGAIVTAVDVPEHAERLLGYGVREVVGPLDLEAGPAEVGGPFDVVVNHVRLQAADLEKLTAYVADGGIVVSSAGPVPEDEDRAVRTAGVWVAPDADGLADLVARVDGGRLKLHIVDRRPLEELGDVHRASADGTLRGKTVITVG